MVAGKPLFQLLIVGLVVLFTLLGTLHWSPKTKNGSYLISGKGDQTIVYSSDAESWTAGKDTNGNIPFGSVGEMVFLNWARERWVAVGDPNAVNGETTAWSDDGKTWHYGTGENFGNLITSHGNVVEYGGGIWVAGGEPGTGLKTVLWSSDGKTWNNSSGDPFGTTTGSCNGLFYNDGLWLAGGRGPSGTDPKIWWSDDGKEWNSGTGSPFGTNVHSAPGRFVYGDDIYVNCGDDQDGNNMIWHSTDGKAWSASTDPFSGGIGQDVKYYGGLFVASAIWATGGNILAYSTDGKTFTGATYSGFTPESGYWADNVYPPVNGFWLAHGSKNTSGAVWKSDDGKTWKDVTPDDFFPGASPTLVHTGHWGKVDGKYRFVISGRSSNGETIWYTEDGETWTNTGETIFGNAGTGVEARWVQAAL